MSQPAFDFDGETYEPEFDRERLNTQMGAVLRYVRERQGEWFAPDDICAAVDANWASVSARLRDLRKPRFGGWCVERKRVEGGLHLYRFSSLAGGDG